MNEGERDGLIAVQANVLVAVDKKGREDTLATSVATDVGLIAHLMRRAGFSVSTREAERLAEIGYDTVVDELLAIEQKPRPVEDLLERFHQDHADEESVKWFSKRWIYRMINSERPLEEKMTLMWHSRFATGRAKVNNSPMMSDHLEMLRDNCLGNFKAMLWELSHSPAMIWWLDQQTNHSEAVNENFGRELLELFSMGRGNYNEDDVRACARAFTGWTIDQTIPRYPNGWYDTNFVYRDYDHDDEEKTFLGETGNFDGNDIVDIVVRQPATGQFVAENIYRYFVSDTPDHAAIEFLTGVYFDSGHEIREVMRALFHSDFFKDARYARVKSPAEHVVGVMKLTGQHTTEYEFGLASLELATLAMGQELLNPPTVEGWHTGHEWIDSAFLIERVNFATERLANLEAPGVIEMINRLPGSDLTLTPDELIDRCNYELGQLNLEERTRRVLKDELDLDGDIPCSGGTSNPEFTDLAVQVIQMLSASKEFQFA